VQGTRWVCSPVRLGSHRGSMRHTLQRGSTATSPRSRQLARPPAHRASPGLVCPAAWVHSDDQEVVTLR
jgi:hypothetical protein